MALRAPLVEVPVVEQGARGSARGPLQRAGPEAEFSRGARAPEHRSSRLWRAGSGAQ